MGLADLFKKKANYFDSKMTPQCGYCQFGKRTKNGGRILCEKKGLVEETSSCGKFIYSPLKRVPVKQLEIEGALTEEEMYAEVAENAASTDVKQDAAVKDKAAAETELAAGAPVQSAANDEIQKALAEAEAAMMQPSGTSSAVGDLNGEQDK